MTRARDTGSIFASDGSLNISTSVNLGDNEKAYFGASNDLQIFHDGSHSYITDSGTGNLYISGTQLYLRSSNNDIQIACVENSSVELYYAGSAKLATTGAGIDVTGTVTADEIGLGRTPENWHSTYIPVSMGQGFNVFARTNEEEQGGFAANCYFDDATSTWKRIGAGYAYRIFSDGGTGGGPLRVLDAGTGSAGDTLTFTERLNVARGSGDISFYDSTGVSQGLYWDASTQRLGINTTTPGARLQVGGNAKLGSASQVTFSGSLTTGGLDVMVGSGAQSAGAFQVWDDNELTTPRFTVTREGNVGIGTSSPSSYTANGNNLVILDTNVGMTLASNSANGSGAIYFADGTVGTETYRGIINYLHASDSMGFFTGYTERLRIDSSGNAFMKTANSYIAGTTSLGFYGDAASSDGMFISSNGRVGIAESAPEQKLHVNGFFLLNNNNEIRFKDSGGTQRTAVAMSSSNDLNIGTSAGGNLKFYNGSSYTERMRIDSSGRVGFNTTSPSSYISSRGIAIRGVNQAGKATYAGQDASDTTGFINMYADSNDGYTRRLDIGLVGAASGKGGGMRFLTYPDSGTASRVHMEIDHAGRVTMPYQPSFLAKNYSSVAVQNFLTGGQVQHDTGSNYNSTNGRFTAPVTGKYFVSWAVLTNASNNRVELELWKNGALFLRANESTGSSSYGGAANSAVVSLNANDYLNVRLQLGTMYSGHENNIFSVHLLG